MTSIDIFGNIRDWDLENNVIKKKINFNLKTHLDYIIFKSNFAVCALNTGELIIY